MSDPLFRCVVDPTSFTTEHWDRRPLLSRAAELPTGGFGDLFSAAVADSLLTERGLRQPFFRVVRDGRPISDITRSGVAGSRTVDDFADPDRIRAAYAEGATIVLQSLNRLWPPIGRFCRDLAARLGHRTQCNAYLTPAGHARGFAFHHDSHDVFVLQVDGTKRWLVHPPSTSTAAEHVSAASPAVDATLDAGDVLYLPRGWVHAAATTDRASIHLTIGVHVTTWQDLLRDLVDQMSAEVTELPRAAPMAADFPAADVARRLIGLASQGLARLPADAVTDLVGRRRRAVVPPEPLGPVMQSAAADRVGSGTRVRPRKGLPAGVRRVDDRVVISLPDKQISVPAIAERLVTTLLAGPVTAHEAAAGDPDCDVSDAVVVVRRLLREGVLAPES